MGGFFTAGVIFDLDGVLIDSEYPCVLRHLEFLRSRGAAASLSDVLPFVGLSSERFWDGLAALLPGRPKGGEAKRQYEAFFASRPSPPPAPLFDGAAHTLRALRGSGVRMAVASSSSLGSIRRALEEHHIEALFEGAVSGMDCPRSKPHPEVYRRALALLGLPPEACCAVEDSPCGIRAARAAGLRVIARRDPRLGLDQSGAHYRVRSLPELLTGPFYIKP